MSIYDLGSGLNNMMISCGDGYLWTYKTGNPDQFDERVYKSKWGLKSVEEFRGNTFTLHTCYYDTNWANYTLNFSIRVMFYFD